VPGRVVVLSWFIKKPGILAADMGKICVTP